MKNVTKFFIIFIIMGAFTISFLFTAAPGYCETAKKVAVCPFQMNSAQDLTFLQKGLFSMLASRISDPGKVEILEREIVDKAILKARSAPETKGPLNESKARIIGQNLNVDYILFGSLTMFGNSVSLDTTMVDVAGSKPSLTFSKQADQPGAVITELDKIATEINYKTFNRRDEEFIPQTQYAQAPPQMQQAQGGGYASPLSNFRVMYSTNGEIIGMSSGDVDGDKKNEVVVVYSQRIDILEDNLNGQLIVSKKIDDGKHMDIVGVDVADINNNGIAEIFITRIQRESGLVKSYVLEYNNGSYKNISGTLPWYLRVVKTDKKFHTLYGQESGKLGPYEGENAFRVICDNGAYVQGEKLRVPNGFTVMSLTETKDVENVNSGRLFTDKEGRLTIFNESGSVEWSGDEGFGGSKLYYEYKTDNEYVQDLSQGRGTFFQPRSLVFDYTSDGKKTVFVIKNEDASGNLFAQIRRYKSGSIEMLRWTEMGLNPEHAPKKMPGQVTDIATGDFDNDAKKELLVTFIKKSNNFSPKKSKSMIVVYDLE